MIETAKKETHLSLVDDVRHQIQQPDEKPIGFPPLLNFLKDKFSDKLKLENKQTVSSGLPNLDVALNGGWSPGLHVIAGTPNQGKRSLLVHMAEEFAKQKHAVIMLTSKESPTSILQRIISRTTFKNNPSKAIPFHQVSQHLLNNPLLLKQLTNQIAPSVKYLSVVKADNLDIHSLEERLHHQKTVHDKSIILLDMHELSSWNADSEKLSLLQQIATNLQIVMIVTYDLNQHDYENMLIVNMTLAGIERHADTISFLYTPTATPKNDSTELPFNASTIEDTQLLSLNVQNNHSGRKQTVYLTHRTNFFYYQEG